MDNIVKKITIELGGNDIDLTPEEAKRLYEALSELLAPKIVYRHSYYPFWEWRPSQAFSGTPLPTFNTRTWYNTDDNQAILKVN